MNEPKPHHTQPLYIHIATAIAALRNCEQSDIHRRLYSASGQDPANVDWTQRWRDRLAAYEQLLPSGSGFDSGSKIDIDSSRGDDLYLETSFHHMDEGGGYDGWTEHSINLTPSFIHGFTIEVKGENRDEISDHIAETFQHCLMDPVTLCPECGMPSHQCKTGDPGCLHCNDCDHTFFKAKEEA